MTIRAQRIMIWWTLAFMLIFGLSYYFLIGLLPLPPATWTPEQVAAFYTENATRVRLGAMILSWASAFPVPIAVVIAVQMARLEKGVPILAILQLCGGLMMSIFLVLPPIFWGIAAFNPSRPPEITTAIHEIANLILVTTDQYFIFQNVAIAWLCLGRVQDAKSPFPRWIGYLTIWAALMFELGAIAFLPKTGPFAWNGLFVFWFPFVIFGTWISVMSWSLLAALTRQEADAAS
ncbi:hypothetical protein [Novosphingobium lentum]|uniref:hypothetical protein n=1 Tax=Novosphingobium lentum TaxID=145287 RepID=UPI00082F9594|nr:hypothetical protein [Novosphingobium lentum]